MDIITDDPDITNYSINFLRENTMKVTREFLTSSNVPDIGLITISQRIISTNKIISHKNKFENIMFSEVLSPLQQE